MAKGESTIEGLLEAEDVLRTASALRGFGAEVEREQGRWRILGVPWRTPKKTLYLGNSGTGARLLMGAAAGMGVGATIDGDASLRARPMGRVLEPLRMMGLEAVDADGRLPVTIEAGPKLAAVTCHLARPSAQVKSAIILAALGAKGTTRIHEPSLCRDHTERLLAVFGAELYFESDGAQGRHIALSGGQRLSPCEVEIPGDPSSAAFIVAAALMTPHSDILVKNVNANPLRLGFYDTLREMGAQIAFENLRKKNGEPVADIRARHSRLHGAAPPPERAPAMIDEYPILAVAAAFASGETKMTGLSELRVKESDRIAAIEAGLVSCGVDVSSGPDGLRVIGDGKPPRGGAVVKTRGDHRIAMSFLVLGCASREAVEIDDGAMIATSFPDFPAAMRRLGALIA
jgi:3-phosphoshikimate 1-carboxyvinyltransferase